MILFVVDQVAGAEYIYPLIRKWLESGKTDWRIVASPVSSAFLGRHEIPHEQIAEQDASQALGILDRFAFDRALVSTSIGSKLEREFVRELRRRLIPCSQLIDNWVNFSKRFERPSGGGEPERVYPDKILTLDDGAKRDMIREGIPEGLIEIVGQPYFEHQARVIRSEPRQTSFKALLVTQPVARFYGERLGYDEISFTQDCLDAWGASGHPWQNISLCVHPAEDIETYRSLLARYSPMIRLISSRELSLRRDYSLVLGMFSSLLVQALLAEVPCASVQIGRKEEDLCSLSRNGSIPRMEGREELVEFLSHPERIRDSNRGADAFGRAIEGSCRRLENFLLHDLRSDVRGR